MQSMGLISVAVLSGLTEARASGIKVVLNHFDFGALSSSS